jgi:hypothetical protein
VRAFGITMRPFITSAAMVLVGVWLATFTGCMSDRAGKQLADAVVSQTITPPVDLCASVTAFRAANKRWPKDREELSTFIDQSGGKLRPISYDHVDFTEKPDGSLGIYASTPSWTNRMTLNVSENEAK